jgi:hypothetical protein
MAIYPLFKISPYDTLFLLPQFNLFLIQGIAGELLAVLTHPNHRDKVVPYTDTSSSLWKYNHRLMGKSP